MKKTNNSIFFNLLCAGGISFLSIGILAGMERPPSDEGKIIHNEYNATYSKIEKEFEKLFPSNESANITFKERVSVWGKNIENLFESLKNKNAFYFPMALYLLNQLQQSSVLEKQIELLLNMPDMLKTLKIEDTWLSLLLASPDFAVHFLIKHNKVRAHLKENGFPIEKLFCAFCENDEEFFKKILINSKKTTENDLSTDTFVFITILIEELLMRSQASMLRLLLNSKFYLSYKKLFTLNEGIEHSKRILDFIDDQIQALKNIKTENQTIKASFCWREISWKVTKKIIALQGT